MIKENVQPFDSYDEGNALLQNIYKQNNYKIEVLNNDSKICMIFFSGNGIYTPNEKKVFQREIVAKNRFEWERISRKLMINNYVGKIIFVRDIFKQWYVTGINSKVNTIDKLKSLLENLTYGYEVITIGNSAGGYMAALMGSMLKAKSIFCFSGQFSIERELSWKEPLLDKYSNDTRKRKYYNNIKMIKEANIPIWYFYPKRCDYDIYQFNLIKNVSNVFSFGFSVEQHGQSMLNENIPYILVSDNDKLEKIYKKYDNESIDRYNFFVESLKILKGKDFWIKEAARLKLLKKEFEDNLNQKDLYLFGSGEDCISFLKSFYDKDKITGIFDNNEKKAGMYLENIPILYSSVLRECALDKIFVVITTGPYYFEIKKQLEDINVKNIYYWKEINLIYNLNSRDLI